MGLDFVELVLALEEAFGVAISDEDAATMVTPGHVVDYLQGRLGGEATGCLEQRAFYRLRHAGIRVLARPRAAFTPGTRWIDLFNDDNHSRQWACVGRAVGVQPWPRLGPFLSWRPSRQTVGETARALATTTPKVFLRNAEGLTRARIEVTVRKLVAEHLGITTFRLSDRFVEDLGVR